MGKLVINGKKVFGMGVKGKHNQLKRKLMKFNFTFLNSKRKKLGGRKFCSEDFEWWVDNMNKDVLSKTVFLNAGSPNLIPGDGSGINGAIGDYTDLRSLRPSKGGYILKEQIEVTGRI